MISARTACRSRNLSRRMAAEREALCAELEALGLPTGPKAPPPPRPARLLLLSCSATKSAAPGLLPVRERYRGPLWLTLGKADPAGALAQVVAVSAELGFVPEWQAIPTYEARLTVATGEALAAEILAGCPGRDWSARGTAARRRHQLARRAATALCAIEWAARRAGRPLEAVAMVGGRAYLAPMRAAVAAAIEAGHVAASAEVVTINATIGMMRRHLRGWLEAPAEAAPAVVEAAELELAAPVEALEPAAAGIGHNGGPVLEAPLAAPRRAPGAHLAQLRQAEARLEAQVAAVLAGWRREVERADSRYQQARGPWHFFASRLARSPRRRAELAAVAAEAGEAAGARRSGQVAQLEAKLERIRRAITTAEAKA